MLNAYIEEFSRFIVSLGEYDLFAFLLFYTIIILVYAIFIWSFYKSVSKRDLFHLKIHDGKHPLLRKTLYVLKYLVLFPVLTFLWFIALTIILIFLSKSYATENIMIISMAIIAATRITAYYKEPLSEDIAKMLPLGILAIFIVDPSYFSISLTLSRFNEILYLGPLLLRYLGFVIALEFVLRLFLAITRFIRSRISP